MHLDLRTVAWLSTALLVAFACLALVRNARTSLTQIALGVIIALALDPLVVAVHRRLGVRRGVGVAIVAFGMLSLGTATILFLGPPARAQASRITADLPDTIHEFEDLPVLGGLVKRFDVQTRVTDFVDALPAKLDDQTVEHLINRVLLNVIGMIVVGSTAVAALLDGERLLARFRRLFRYDEKRLRQVEGIGRVLYATLGQYFGGSLTVALLMGLFVLAVGLALAIPLAPLAALWAMLTDLVPQVGGFLGGSFLVLLALAKGPIPALIAASLFIIYMNIENHLISPAIVGESVNLTPPTTMLAAFIGGAVAGIPGALVATPLVGAAKRLYLQSRHGETTSAARPSLLSRLRKAIRHRDR